MTNQGFSDGFDTLLNSYRLQGEFGEAVSKMDTALDEYEKSLFLTKAQEELVLSLYNGKNPSSESFEQTEELRRYLAPLIKEAELSPLDSEPGVNGYWLAYDDTTGIINTTSVDGSVVVPSSETGIATLTFNTQSPKKYLGISSNSTFFALPADLWFITYEAVLANNGKCEDTTTLDVYPAKQDEYHKIKRNPFRGANDYRALRFDLGEGNIEIVSKYPVTSYYVRYLKTLSPIVLVDLPDGLEIKNQSTAASCELPEALHQRILELAVVTALQTKGFSTPSSNKE